MCGGYLIHIDSPRSQLSPTEILVIPFVGAAFGGAEQNYFASVKLGLVVGCGKCTDVFNRCQFLRNWSPEHTQQTVTEPCDFFTQ